MPSQDTSQIKEKIIFALRQRGPCLPVHIANELKTSILFASAFLSELVSEKKIIMSHMRVGSSPLYFLSGQEHALERFAHYLKSKEKDAFSLLKEKEILEDANQEPAIRVALRAIRDFAIPFQRNERLFWRYYLSQEREIKSESPKPEIKRTDSVEKNNDIKNKQDSTEEQVENENKSKEKPLNIFEKEESVKEIPKKTFAKKPSRKSSATQKKNEKFFNKVKEFLAEKSIGISDIEGFSKTDLILKVIDNGVEKVLVAYNKKRITEVDLLKAYKKASEENLPYRILSLGEVPKKLQNLMQALEKLSAIDKIE